MKPSDYLVFSLVFASSAVDEKNGGSVMELLLCVSLSENGELNFGQRELHSAALCDHARL